MLGHPIFTSCRVTLRTVRRFIRRVELFVTRLSLVGMGRVFTSGVPGGLRSIEGLMKQVAFCNRQIRSDLNDHEVENIVAYLNEAFYRFTMD